MSAQDNVTLIHTLIQAFNSHDADPFAANATEDCEILDVASGMTLSGPEGWRQFNQGFITAFPDGQIQATNVFTTDDQGVFEFTGRGTNTGPFPSPAGQIPPTGRQYSLLLRFIGLVATTWPHPTAGIRPVHDLCQSPTKKMRHSVVNSGSVLCGCKTYDLLEKAVRDSNVQVFGSLFERTLELVANCFVNMCLIYRPFGEICKEKQVEVPVANGQQTPFGQKVVVSEVVA